MNNIGASGNYQFTGSSEKWKGFMTRFDIANLTIGGMNLTESQVPNPIENWVGEIDYVAITGQVLTREEANIVTGFVKDQVVPDPNQPFALGDAFGSNCFRIPALFTLVSGDIMAAMDVRYGGMDDSPNNLDTGIRFYRNGSWGEHILLNEFQDYESKASGKVLGSASFIDPAITQNKDTGRLYLFADGFPSGGGLFDNYKNLYGNGTVEVDGVIYEGLSAKRPFTNLQTMEYYFKPVSNFDADKVYGNEVKYEVYQTSNNVKTPYSINGNYELLYYGDLQYVEQKDSSGNGNGIMVPASIFYGDSDLSLYPVGYLYLKHSDDNGNTWSDPKIICSDGKSEGMRYLIAGPGRGLTLEHHPTLSGRVLFPIYIDSKVTAGDAGSNGERSGVVYSDDHGNTWHTGEFTTMASSNSPGKSSKAQMIEFKDGTVRMFARSNGGVTNIGYADSYDGGVSYDPMVVESGIRYGSNCQISVINYSGQIDGKDVVILSAPEGDGVSTPSWSDRSNGVIWVGLVHVDERVDPLSSGRNTIDWAYRFEITPSSQNAPFFYSCLTELPNGDIGLLYETSYEIPNYVVYTLAELTANPVEKHNYAISKKATEHGSFTVDETSAPVGTTITITGEGVQGYIVDEVSVTRNANTGAVTVTKEENGSYTFLMPAEPVSVGVTFAEDIEEISYTITGEGTTNGNFIVSADSAKEGTEITITTTAESGYEVSEVSVTGVAQGEIQDQGNGVYTFLMPAEDVRVSVSFTKIVETKYPITLNNPDQAIVEGLVREAKEGDRVQFSVTAEGHSITVEINQGHVVVTESGGIYSFVMPMEEVTIDISLIKNSYEVTLNEVTPEFGTVTLRPSGSVLYGETVIIDAQPKTVLDTKTASAMRMDSTIGARIIVESGEITEELETDGIVEVPETDGTVEVPEADGNVEVPEGDGDVEVPETDGNVEVPETDGNVEVPETEGESGMLLIPLIPSESLTVTVPNLR